MATSNTPDLELIQTEKLLDEIFKRFDGAVFCGIHNTSKTDWHSRTKIEGKAIECLAASALLQANVAARVEKENGQAPQE